MEEIELSGGLVSAPVKVGDTVRRTAGPWTPAVHSLLNYLHDNGFSEAPRPLGIDTQGREILNFLPGMAALRPWPEVLRTGDGLAQAARLVRRYHDVVVGFVPSKEAIWRIGKVNFTPGQIIRHGDLGPWNTLWQRDHLTALLDWDFAEPGERITDLAQLAWYFVPLRGEEYWGEAAFKKRPDFRQRLELVAREYDGFDVLEILHELDRLQNYDLEITKRLGGQGIHPWNLFFDRGGVQILKKENAWLKEIML
jgi:hypothetical protein